MSLCSRSTVTPHAEFTNMPYTKQELSGECNIPEDMMIASFATHFGRFPSAGELYLHVYSCRWCADWLRSQMEVQANAINDESWATGFWK
jgi:hypothetical protein